MLLGHSLDICSLERNWLWSKSAGPACVWEAGPPLWLESEASDLSALALEGAPQGNPKEFGGKEMGELWKEPIVCPWGPCAAM